MFYGIESYTAIIGNEPEMADMSNPNGHIYGEIYYATATTKDGMVYAYHRSYTDKQEAIGDAIFLEETETDPVGSESFDFVRIAYGSEAHRLNYHEVERSLMDAEERDYHDRLF